MQQLPAKDKSIAAAKFLGRGKETEYRIEGNPGLILVCQKPRADGTVNKVWRCYYSATKDGKQRLRKKRLGRYPYLSLSKARLLCAEVRQAVDQGIDVVEQGRRLKVAEEQASLTFKELVHDYIAIRRAVAQPIRTLDEIERALRASAVPALGHLNPKDISAEDIEACIDVLKDKNHLGMARHLLSYIGTLFNYAIRSAELAGKYGVKVNPAAHVGRALTRGERGKYGKSEPGERALTDSEIVELWSAFGRSHAEHRTKVVIWILLLTGQRPSQVRKMTIEELDLGAASGAEWSLAGSRTKNRKPHVVPLVPQVVELLQAQIEDRKSGPVFPDETGQFLHKDSIRGALDRMFDHGHLTCPEFTPRDLRRTVASGMARLRVIREIRDRVLHHTDSSVGATHYNRHDYLSEKREALETWTSHVYSLLEYEADTTSGLLDLNI